MDDIELPKIKSASLTERVTIPVDKEIKEELARLKSEDRIDVTAWLRAVIRRELAYLKRGA